MTTQNGTPTITKGQGRPKKPEHLLSQHPAAIKSRKAYQKKIEKRVATSQGKPTAAPITNGQSAPSAKPPGTTSPANDGLPKTERNTLTINDTIGLSHDPAKSKNTPPAEVDTYTCGNCRAKLTGEVAECPVCGTGLRWE